MTTQMIDHDEKRSVLVIDDDDAILETIKILLEDRGFDVLIAEDGRVALDLLGRLTPDVIVLDLMMPRMDGFSFVKQLEERGLRNCAPILVLTAAGKARPMVAQMGVEGYLDKPFSADALLAEIERVMRDRRA